MLLNLGYLRLRRDWRTSSHCRGVHNQCSSTPNLCNSNPRDILYKGKTAQELTHKELIECAHYLKDAHLHLVKQIDELNARIRQLERRLDKQLGPPSNVDCSFYTRS
jgi:hypothetical protein